MYVRQLLKEYYGYVVAQNKYYEESSLGMWNVKLRVMELGIVHWWFSIMFVSLDCGQL